MCWCAIAFNGRSSDGSERRWTSFPVCLYWCAVWLVSMLVFMLVSILRLVDSVPLLCTFLEVSTCVVASALWLKPGSATVLELSFSSCWKFCGTLLRCVGMLSMECLLRVVLPGINVHVSTFFSLSCMDWFHSRAGMFSMSGHVIVSFPCRNCFPRKDCVFSRPGGNSAWIFLVVWVRWSFMHISMGSEKCLACSSLYKCSQLAHVFTSCFLGACIVD